MKNETNKDMKNNEENLNTEVNKQEKNTCSQENKQALPVQNTCNSVPNNIYGGQPPAGGYYMHSYQQPVYQQPRQMGAMPPQYTYGTPMTNYYMAPVQTVQKVKQPFTATRADGWFAILCYVLGFFFCRWLFLALPWEGWGVTAFTTMYVVVVLLYAVAKHINIVKESWFWLAVVAACGITYSLWPGGSMGFYRGLLLFGSSIYWTGSLFGGLLQGTTTNNLILDAINLLFIVPFRNFGVAFKAFGGFKSPVEDTQKAKTTKNRIVAVIIGLCICIPLLAIILPLLLEADGGNFAALTEDIREWFTTFFEHFSEMDAISLVLGIPVGLYICGLMQGLAHKRYIQNIDVKKSQRSIDKMRIIPQATMVTVLCVVLAVYAVFIGCQIPYFFSAFVGQRPEGYEVYAEYARSGFFELCKLVALNMGLLVAANITSKVPRMQNKILRMMNIILAAITLLLVATAMSKMLLYIDAYGLTTRRLLPSIFMGFLAIICIAVMVLQFRQFSIVRVAAVLGSIILCGICLINIDSVVLQYNADRFLNGSLPSFDVDLLYEAKSSGVPAAIRVYEEGSDKLVVDEIETYLRRTKNSLDRNKEEYHLANAMDNWAIKQLDVVFSEA